MNYFYGGDDNDQVGGGNGADHLFGGAGNDVLSGYPRVQEMLGGNGDDLVTVNGLTGDPVPVGQVLNGGLGFDRLNWTGQSGGVVDLTTGAYTTIHGSQLLGFEAFGLYVAHTATTTVSFGAGNDRLESGSAAFALTVNAGADDDTIIARTTTTATLNGGSGNDHLTSYYGTGGDLAGGSGNDVLWIYSAAGCTLDGGGGADRVVRQ